MMFGGAADILSNTVGIGLREALRTLGEVQPELRTVVCVCVCGVCARLRALAPTHPLTHPPTYPPTHPPTHTQT